jgi:hypothetical protein
VDEAGVRADDFGQMGQEGDDVVLGLALDLVDARDVEGGRFAALFPDRLGGFLLRDDAEVSARCVAGMRLDLEPDAELEDSGSTRCADHRVGLRE